MPRALKACGECGTPVQRTPCPDCRPKSGKHLQSAKDRGNTTRMKKLAARVKRRQPWCGWPSGCNEPITEDNPLTLGHLVPRSVNPDLMYDETNCITLCHHHNMVQGRRILTLDGQLLDPQTREPVG